jgi:hypothetical protein
VASLTDQIDAAVFRNPGDSCGLVVERIWQQRWSELEEIWPATVTVAGMLLDGADVAAITAAVTGGLVANDRKGAA